MYSISLLNGIAKGQTVTLSEVFHLFGASVGYKSCVIIQYILGKWEPVQVRLSLLSGTVFLGPFLTKSNQKRLKNLLNFKETPFSLWKNFLNILLSRYSYQFVSWKKLKEGALRKKGFSIFLFFFFFFFFLKKKKFFIFFINLKKKKKKKKKKIN